MKLSLKEDGKRLLAVCLAALIISINIKTFVHAGGLFPGGLTGMTILIQRIALRYFNTDLPFTPINLALNAFPIYLGFRFLGKKFTFSTVVLTVLTSVFTDMIPSYPITYDRLLIAIFGGMINGFAASICLLAGSSAGGTDFISLYLSEKHGIDSFNLILGCNAVMLVVAGALFGWSAALYSIIYQFIGTQVIHSLYRRYQQATLFIVTDFPDEVCKAISGKSHHGSTTIHGRGSYEHARREIVYSVVSAQEVKGVVDSILEVDPHAFINAIKTERIIGTFYRKPTD